MKYKETLSMKAMKSIRLLVGIIMLLGVVTVSTSTAADKPTIHALLIVMDGDARYPGRYEIDHKRIQPLLRDIQDQGICGLKLTTLRSAAEVDSKRPSRARVLQWINGLTPRPNDVVFVYFAGHGGQDTDGMDDGTFLSLIGRDVLYRTDIVSSLKSSKAWNCRLKMLITDSCSGNGRGETLTNTSPTPNYNKTGAFKNLFVEHEGFLHIASASPGEVALGDSASGGWFTTGLVGTIYSHADAAKRFVGWNEVFSGISEHVQKSIQAIASADRRDLERRGIRIQQTPKFYSQPVRARAWSENQDTHENPNIAPNARILQVWVDHDQIENNLKGMQIHVKFDVNNFMGKRGKVNAYFYTHGGDRLKDSNERYRTTSGNVSVGESFTPRFVNSRYNDFKLFMPYSELHRPKAKHDLKFRVQVFNPDTGNALSSVSDWVNFTYTSPEAEILKVWLDHNQFKDSVKGMWIHVQFKVHHFKDELGSVNAYFYSKSGEALKDFNKKYRTTNGNVSVGRSFTPRYVKSRYNDFKLFMPYSEFHMPEGKHNLKLSIQIFNKNIGKSISSKSNPKFFYINR